MSYQLKYKIFPNKGTIINFNSHRLQLSIDDIEDLIEELALIRMELKRLELSSFDQKEKLL